ncbi:MAG: hypothetical protein ACE5I1_05020 [bacterium]
MPHLQTILNNVRRNLAQEGFRFYKGTTTSAGATDGTSIVDSNLTGIADAWNHCQAALLDGSFGEMSPQDVEDYTLSPNTLLFTNNPFPYQVASGVAYELYDGGNFSSWNLRNFILDAARWVLKRAPLGELRNYELEYPVAGSLGANHGLIALPTGILAHQGRYAPFTRAIRIQDGDYPFQLVDQKRWWFVEQDLDAGVLPVTGEMRFVGYYSGRAASSDSAGQIVYLPKVSETFLFTALPEPSFDSSGNWKIPNSLWDQIEKVTTGFALAAEDYEQKAQFWFGIGGYRRAA